MLTKYQPDPHPQTREADQQKMREAIQKELQSLVKAAQAAGQTGPRAFIVVGQQTISNWKAEQFRDALRETSFIRSTSQCVIATANVRVVRRS